MRPPLSRRSSISDGRGHLYSPFLKIAPSKIEEPNRRPLHARSREKRRNCYAAWPKSQVRQPIRRFRLTKRAALLWAGRRAEADSSQIRAVSVGGVYTVTQCPLR